MSDYYITSPTPAGTIPGTIYEKKILRIRRCGPSTARNKCASRYRVLLGCSAGKIRAVSRSCQIEIKNPQRLHFFYLPIAFLLSFVQFSSSSLWNELILNPLLRERFADSQVSTTCRPSSKTLAPSNYGGLSRQKRPRCIGSRRTLLVNTTSNCKTTKTCGNGVSRIQPTFGKRCGTSLESRHTKFIQR